MLALFAGADDGKRIFEGMAAPQANFKILATHVRQGEKPKHYILRDGGKWKSVVEKWRFAPTQEPLSRCGYDYMIVFTNGDANVPISICFRCNTLIVNHAERYRTSKKQIMTLFSEDFSPLT